ncbi:putative nucleotidyltransferase [Sedimentisphaera cyanobacteriorum]|uniref:Putative nucleotidyltransferase n=1 Tax=Sedimentisphaera cyanobacteriorum TaxID=1940790 RepID=A0A1Q2HST3_9BACT|nr:nucleotidyltransferase domain-containing protein [Sedimentisphaera cyanobacteriorum]AQQ10391.1 putative nucleotidyltransferase [Sedimentisphaera cyanobacteriorum]
MLDRRIIDSIKKYLRALSEAGIEADFAVLYGSQARGDSGKWSDIDLLVVSEEFDNNLTREKVNKLWHIAAFTDCRIEPLPCGREQWEMDDSNLIIEIARNEGMKVAV